MSTRPPRSAPLWLLVVVLAGALSPVGKVQAAEPSAPSAEPAVMPAEQKHAPKPAFRRAGPAPFVAKFYAGKMVVMSGAAGGIGLALTEQLLAAKAHVLAGTLEDSPSAELLALAAKYPGALQLGHLDVTNKESIEKFKGLCTEQHVDVLINTAGVNIDDHQPILELPEERIQATFNVNASGPVRMVQAFYPLLKASKRPIVANISSIMGSIGDNRIASSTAYRMSKAALNMFGKSLAIEQPDLIVLSLHPGWVKTKMGSQKADINPPVSAAGIMRVIARATKTHSGRFFRYTGEPAPW